MTGEDVGGLGWQVGGGWRDCRLDTYLKKLLLGRRSNIRRRVDLATADPKKQRRAIRIVARSPV